MTQSADLTAFYDAYVAWLDTGENPHGFLTFTGLCDGIMHMPCQGKLAVMYWEMKQQFRDAGLHEAYPFDDGSPDLYAACEDKRWHPQRMAWVRARTSKALANA